MLFKEIETQHGSLHWAKFFLELGRLYGQQLIHDDAAHNLIIKMPYTDFIPQLISLGFADQLYSQISAEPPDTNLKEKLVPGTIVYYRSSPTLPEEPYKFLDFYNSEFPIIEDMKKNTLRIKITKNWEKKIRIANEQVIYKKSRALKNKTLNSLKQYYPAARLEQLARLNNYRILIVGNETKLKQESEATIQGLNLHSWLLMRQFLHSQSYYLTNIYSSKFKKDLEELPFNTLIIYSSLEAFYHFHEELNMYSSIILYSSFENSPMEIEALSTVVDLLDTYKASSLLESKLSNSLPKGVDIGTWIIH